MSFKHFDAMSQAVLAQALKEAEALGDAEIRPEHLLLALSDHLDGVITIEMRDLREVVLASLRGQS